MNLIFCTFNTTPHFYIFITFYVTLVFIENQMILIYDLWLILWLDQHGLVRIITHNLFNWYLPHVTCDQHGLVHIIHDLWPTWVGPYIIHVSVWREQFGPIDWKFYCTNYILTSKLCTCFYYLKQIKMYRSLVQQHLLVKSLQVPIPFLLTDL